MTDNKPHAALGELMANLSPRKAAFVAAYLQHGNGAQAAREAGYSSNENAAKSRAWALLNRDPDVIAAVAAAHATVAEQAVYDANKAMAELHDAMAFAKSTNNATALARCIELRSKISGVLIERAEIKSAVVNIDLTLAEARSRASRYLEIEAPHDEPAMIEATDEAAMIEDIFK